MLEPIVIIGHKLSLHVSRIRSLGLSGSHDFSYTLDDFLDCLSGVQMSNYSSYAYAFRPLGPFSCRQKNKNRLWGPWTPKATFSTRSCLAPIYAAYFLTLRLRIQEAESSSVGSLVELPGSVSRNFSRGYVARLTHRRCTRMVRRRRVQVTLHRCIKGKINALVLC